MIKCNENNKTDKILPKTETVYNIKTESER